MLHIRPLFSAIQYRLHWQFSEVLRYWIRQRNAFTEALLCHLCLQFSALNFCLRLCHPWQRVFRSLYIIPFFLVLRYRLCRRFLETIHYCFGLRSAFSAALRYRLRLHFSAFCCLLCLRPPCLYILPTKEILFSDLFQKKIVEVLLLEILSLHRTLLDGSVI